ncbi:beta-ketoacyl synthase [Pseudoalteromonas citrea]|uniref:Beta-ketoacyl synthase n=1 Tax=Pseudoalteromonas citrea TaxID=43655 RepID=A0A5S3XMC2_9GAMM|nr:AMP-binding protein [Pseudoalteromonas citrea]TMP40319.1 beta-ketoacyl synthase [Pseudoalteromonas citrea]TMP56932.1 beta-ketoacyl synthase [Pseudoalteromonas citrea]
MGTSNPLFPKRDLLQCEADSLIDLLASDAINKPEQEVFQFMVDKDESPTSYSYQALATAVSQVAQQLINISLAPQDSQDQALIVLPQGVDFVTAFYGCMAARVIAVPSFPPKNQLQVERLEYAMTDLGNPIVITTKAIQPLLQEQLVDKEVRWLLIDDCATIDAPQLHEFKTKNSDIALLQYSSGTTGKPKGVIITNQNTLENSELIRQSFGHKENTTRMMLWLPPHHDMGLVGGVMQGVYTGYPTLLMPTDIFLRSQFTWLKAVTDFKATTTGAPNFAFDLAVKNIRPARLDELDLSSLENLFCGAEPINAHTITQFFEKFSQCGLKTNAFLPCYGMAEATLMVSGKPHGQQYQQLCIDEPLLKRGVVKQVSPEAKHSQWLVSSGIVHHSLNAKIVDPVTHTEVAMGQVGEVWLQGSSISPGYWQDEPRTIANFGLQLGNYAETYHRTGDLGFYDNDELFITGRLKEVIILRGANFYPQDLEYEASLAFPELKNCRSAAFSVASEQREQLVMAIEVPRNVSNFEALTITLNARLIERFGIKADQVLFLPRKTIKITSSGKLQRVAIKQAFEQAQLQTYFHFDAQHQQKNDTNDTASTHVLNLQDTTSVQQWLIYQVTELTGVPSAQISAQDSLANVGLDSVLAMEILFRLEQQTGVYLAPDVLYSSNTPSLLAEKITQVANKNPQTELDSTC